MENNNTKSKETKDKILKAATSVFAQQGYHGTKVDDIVDASDTSKGSVYFHFPSKQEIFLAIIDKFAIKLESQLVKAIAKEAHGIDRVNAALTTCLETFGQYKSLAKIFLVQAAGLGLVFEEKQIEIHNRFSKVITKHLDEAIEEGEMKPIDTEVAGFVWMGAINDVVIRWVRTGQPEPKRAIPTLRTMLLRSVGIEEDRVQSFGEK